jgi:predicted dehydrogenase
MIGTGSIADVHLEAWKRLPVELIGHYDLRSEAAVRAQERFGGRIYDDIGSLLADADLVDICTPASAHKACVLAAASAETPMICEKPLARHLEDCEEMVIACAAAKVPLYVAHVVRFFPQFEQAKALIDSGEIGRPAVLRTVRAGSFPRFGGAYGSSIYGNFDLSGGVVLDVSIHDIDFLRWCCGEVTRVFARGLTFRDEPERDHALIVLRFANGAIGHIEGSWAHPTGMWRTRLEIAGDAGIIEWDSLAEMPFFVAQSDGQGGMVQQTTSPLAADTNPYYAELAHFLDCHEHGVTPRVSAHDALMAVKISLAAIESMRIGQPIDVAGFEEVLL